MLAKFRRFKRYRRTKPIRPISSKPLPFRYVLLLSFTFFILSTAIGLWIVNVAIKPALYAYAESQSINIATAVINNAIKDQIGEGLRLDQVTRSISNERSEILSFDFDTIHDYSTKITNSILEGIHEVEIGNLPEVVNGNVKNLEPSDNGILFQIPFGRITNNALLGGIGPNIPVKFQAIGDIQYDIETTYEALQINSTWYEIRLHMKVGIQIIVPFTTKMKHIERNILFAAGEIRGDVPQFYSNGGGLIPSFTVPIQGNNNSDQ